MPTPNYSDPTLIQWMQQMQQRMSAIEQSFQGVKDANGRTRMKSGLLPNGDFGILLIDAQGNQQELLPAVSDYHDGTLSTASATPVSLVGSPSVTVVIGASGDCKITCGSFIGVGSNASGIVYLQIDGGASTSILELSDADPSGAAAANVQSTRKYSQWTGGTLTPGSHTFGLLYSSSSGTSNFSSNWLEVQPI